MVKIATAALGGVILIGLIAWFGGQSIGADVLRAGWAIPGNIVIHLCQLLCAAASWRLLVGARDLTLLAFLRLRIIREGVNSLLPVAQIGGPVVAVRIMMGLGVPGSVAGAATTADLTVEAAMQLVYTAIGIALMRALGVDPAWAKWVEGGLATGALGVVAFIVAQRFGLMRLVESAIARLQKRFPALSGDSLAGLHLELMRLQQEPWVLVKAALLQLASWSGGMFEVWLALYAMGHPVGLTEAFVIECLGMAARSAGFAVPGALGVQEGGFILVCGLFGIGPDIGLAVSMVKRLREVTVGSAGLLMWQWAEISRWMQKRRGVGKKEGRVIIYHMCRAEEWRAAEQGADYRGSSQDVADGFIHFSNAAQIKESAAKHRAGQDGLLLIACDSGKMGEGLKWEPSRGGQLFPHHYGALPMAAVVSARPLPLGADGLHIFPELE